MIRELLPIGSVVMLKGCGKAIDDLWHKASGFK